MGFRANGVATVWKFTTEKGFPQVQISTSRKNKKTDEWETDFSGFAALSGDARNKASLIEAALNRDSRYRIRVLECDVSKKYVPDENKEYVNFTIFDFEDANATSNDNSATAAPVSQQPTYSRPATRPAPVHTPMDGPDDNELPF